MTRDPAVQHDAEHDAQHGADALVLTWGSATDVGRRRKVNEDAFLVGDGVFLVADGMGGHDLGEVASAVTVDVFTTLQSDVVLDGAHVAERVATLVGEAQTRVRGIATGTAGRGAGTTLTGAVVVHQGDVPYWLFLNVGDSRTYLMSGGTLDQVTVDHSEVAELVAAGSLTTEQARTHPRRNVVTRALGSEAFPVPDLRYVPVSANDRVLVCSDGLTSELTDARIAQVLLEHPDAQLAANRLVAEAYAAGGRDNITVVVVDATGAGPDVAATSPRAVLVQDDDEDTVPVATDGRAVARSGGQPRSGTEGDA